MFEIFKKYSRIRLRFRWVCCWKFDGFFPHFKRNDAKNLPKFDSPFFEASLNSLLLICVSNEKKNVNKIWGKNVSKIGVKNVNKIGKILLKRPRSSIQHWHQWYKSSYFRKSIFDFDFGNISRRFRPKRTIFFLMSEFLGSGSDFWIFCSFWSRSKLFSKSETKKILEKKPDLHHWLVQSNFVSFTSNYHTNAFVRVLLLKQKRYCLAVRSF